MSFRPFTRAALASPAAIAVAGWLVQGGVALAQPEAQGGAPSRTFMPYVFAVYTITWLAFFGYLFYVNRRQRDLRREIEELERQWEEKRGTTSSSFPRGKSLS
ncbi:MAG: CcmD family protein [Chloroflexi bacterium]|nr:CcmD family protein [Chloroflexota bacterium]